MLEYHAVDTRVPFVGRAEDLRELLAFLKRGGALTLVGPGGVGKTRLAHEAIARYASENAVECAFIPLAGVMPEAVVGTVMSVLRLSDEPGRTPHQTIADRLAERALILAIDNCEHAPDETGALIDALRTLPGLSILATSQRRLDYTDENVYEVGPFAPEDGIAFFVARAGIEASRIDEKTLATVGTIVERVDGLAVALDLAAARLASLSLDGLAGELDELRPYQLRSTRGSEPRHRTIGNVIAWSHSQLSDRAKRAFGLASLFADEFDEDDLGALGDLARDEVRAALDELVANSLILTTEFGYRMLLPIRAVATRMLVAMRNRRALDGAFARRMNQLAIELRAQMYRDEQAGVAVKRLHMRYGDFCTALGWALKRPQERIEQVSDIPTAMMTIWADGGRFAEGLRWTERLESVAQRMNPETRGRLYYLGLCVAHAASEYHRMVENGPLTISAFTIAGDRLGLARAYNALAAASLNTGRLDDATTYVETALRFYEQLAHGRGIATALINQGSIFFEGHGDLTRAHETFRKAISLVDDGGLDVLCGTAVGDLAEVEYAMAEYDGA
ncbi:MAG TPA: AAA family ATPase, partial [Candidatus Aquilonibacter sp.]